MHLSYKVKPSIIKMVNNKKNLKFFFEIITKLLKIFGEFYQGIKGEKIQIRVKKYDINYRCGDFKVLRIQCTMLYR